MPNQSLPKPRFIVPAALAVMLTFARSGMLPFEDIYTPFDMAINVFVVIIAPLYALLGAGYLTHIRNFNLLIPFYFLAFWVLTSVFIGSPKEFWPSSTALITMAVSIYLATQITCFELRRLRHMILMLTGIFCVYLMIFGASTLTAIVTGTLSGRLGADVSSANLIIFPRIMYMLIITCLASLVIERNKLIRLASAVMIVFPLLIALATGGRGPMVACIIASIIFVLGLNNKTVQFVAVSTISTVLIAGYFVIDALFPILLYRMQEDKDSGRFEIWSDLLHSSKISLLGKGIVEDYPHNIFLEMLLNYGIVGLVFFTVLVVLSFRTACKYYANTKDSEALWVIALLVLQLISQQLSLDLFYGSFWAALLLPLVLYNNAKFGAPASINKQFYQSI